MLHGTFVLPIAALRDRQPHVAAAFGVIEADAIEATEGKYSGLTIDISGLGKVQLTHILKQTTETTIYLLSHPGIVVKTFDLSCGKPGEVSYGPYLRFNVELENFDLNTLKMFAKLDDYDIISAMKQWMEHDDFVLRNLCEMLLNRNLLKVKLKKKPVNKKKLQKYREQVEKKYNLSPAEADYFVFSGEISNLAYSTENDKIQILHRNGKVSDVAIASDQLYLKALSAPVTKYYICYPKT